MQDDLIAKIVASVAGRIEKQRSSRAARKRPGDMEAYDCLLRGLAFHRIGGVTRENEVQALAWLNRAIEKDPTMARAYAWKACAVATVAEWDQTPLEDNLEETRDLASKALDLDETDAESHRIMGSVSLFSRDYDRALYHFGRAVELNPNHAYNLGRIGEIHNFLGDGNTALTYQKQALRLDPFLPEYCRELEIVAHYVLGEFSECHRVASEMPRRTRRSAAYHAAALVHLPDDALRTCAVRDLSVVDPDFNPDSFLEFEFYRDPALSEKLRADLTVVRAEIDKLVAQTGIDGAAGETIWLH